MIIEDIYDGGHKRLYSVLFSPEEMRIFSKIQDEDYENENRGRQKSAKHLTPVVGGALGALIGSYFGKKGTLAGGALGVGSGYLLGKDSAKNLDRELERYRKASEKDKKYLREKRSQEKQREAIRQAGANAGFYAGLMIR